MWRTPDGKRIVALVRYVSINLIIDLFIKGPVSKIAYTLGKCTINADFL